MEKILPKEVCSVADISYRQFQYWDAKGYITPNRSGKGMRVLRLTELMLYVSMAELKKKRHSVQKITREFLPWIKRKVCGSSDGGALAVSEFGPGGRFLINTHGEMFLINGHFATTSQTVCFLDYDEVVARLKALPSRQDNDSNDGVRIGVTPAEEFTSEFSGPSATVHLNSTEE